MIIHLLEYFIDIPTIKLNIKSLYNTFHYFGPSFSLILEILIKHFIITIYQTLLEIKLGYIYFNKSISL